MSNNSKFKNVLVAAKEREKQQEEVELEVPIPVPEVENPKVEIKERSAKLAKRGNKDYQAITAYIKVETYWEAKGLLLRQKKQLTELIDELIAEWVEKQKS